jgi:PAS domain S-box-containing protein
MMDGIDQSASAVGDAGASSTQPADAAEQARSNDARFWLAAIADASGDALIGNDLNDIVISWNKAAESMFGYSDNEMIGQPITLIIPQSRIEEELAISGRISRGERVAHFETQRQTKDGRIIPISLSISPVYDAAGKMIGTSKIARDCSERDERVRELNAVVTELKRTNKEVEAFVYMVSHDLKAPLVNLQGFSHELLLSCAELQQAIASLPVAPEITDAIRPIVDEDIAGALGYIGANVSKFERLINALLRLSRTGQQIYELETIDIRRIVESTVALLRSTAEKAGATISLGELPNAVADIVATEQVFANLIGNAIKYLQPGRQGEIEVAGIAEGGMAHYWVRDNGAGIAEQSKARLFQVFQRFHPELGAGDGMGLAAVKRIVERHGGAVWVDSIVGSGSTFHFTLPAADTDQG